MNNKKLLQTITGYIIVFALLPQQGALGYETATHARMSDKAALKSENLTNNLSNIGLTSLLDELNRDGITQTALAWIEEGAIKEDDTISEVFARYKNHFYDPINKPHEFGGILWRNSGIVSGTATAPDWAIDKVEADGQLYSFKQARTYFYDGLTKPAKADRDSKLATMFRTLGDVVHLVQDMAQPQHTRNDGHFTGSLYEKYVDGANPKLTGGTIPVIQMARDFLTNNC